MLLPPSVTRVGSLGCHPERSEGSSSRGTKMLRYAQHDGVVTSATAHCCHPERSEGSLSIGSEMLRYAQHDNGALSMTALYLPAVLCQGERGRPMGINLFVAHL